MTEQEFVYTPNVAPALSPRLEASALRRGESARRAIERLALDCLAEIAANAQAMAASDAPEGPHQFRVGLRRLRSLVQLAKPLLEPGFAAWTNAEARRLATLAATARALDVARLEVLPAAAAEVDAAALAELDRRLERAARTDADRVRAAAETPAFLLETHRRLLEGAWTADRAPGVAARKRTRAGRRLDAPAEAWAARALAVCWARFARAGVGLGRRSVEERHAFRKAGKSMRYAMEFFAPLFGAKASRPLRAELKTLQTILGSMNDAAEADSLARFAPEPKFAETIAAIVALHRARMAADWPKARAQWKRVKKADRVWR